MTQTHSSAPDIAADTRTTQVRLILRIPKDYHHDPVISNLASQYHLSVNILGAMLGANAQGDGWFDLELSGKSSQIDSALIYLSDLDVEIISRRDRETDGW
jgi:ABC-type methionine transport system ATPase subunit